MEKKRILIVDDDPGVQDAIRFVFDEQKYEVIIFESGASILSGQYPLPDIFLLDKQLSGIDGLDICKFLKNQPTTKHIPIIMLSASPHIARMAEAAGADDTLEKPFSIKDLRAVVEKHVNVSK